MGFAPTIIEKPNGNRMILNWTQNFYDQTDCLAADIADIKVAKDFNDWNGLPYFKLAAEITYFLADI